MSSNTQDYLQKLIEEKQTKQLYVKQKDNHIQNLLDDIEYRTQTEKSWNDLKKEREALDIKLEAFEKEVAAAQKALQIYRSVRRDPEYKRTTQTPAEHRWENILDQNTIFQEQMDTMIDKIQELHTELLKMPNYLELRSSLSQHREEREKTQKEIEVIDTEIKEVKQAIRCLDAQQYLESQIPKYSSYIYENWTEDSEDLIHAHLWTEGDKKNCAFTTNQVKDCIEFIDQAFFSDPSPEEEEDDEEEEEMSLEDFEKRMQELFLPELIVAFAHTLYIQTFPPGFFEGKFGMVGIESRPNGIFHVGVLPLDAEAALEYRSQPVPKELQDMLRQDNIYRERVFYSFRPEKSTQNKGQISDLNRFRNEFWRFHNFLGFDLEAKLYVHFEKQNEDQVEKDALKYVKTRKQQGLYLEDFLSSDSKQP